MQLINAGVVVALTECLGAEDETVRERAAADLEILIGKGLHSFPFQLNLSSSVQRITQINSCMCPGVAQVELKGGRTHECVLQLVKLSSDVNECEPLLIGVAGAKGCNQMLEDGAVEKLLSLLDDTSPAVRNAVYNALVEGCMRSAAVQARLCSTEGTLEGLLAKAGEEDPERVAGAYACSLFSWT